jgi:hypothetical protein
MRPSGPFPAASIPALLAAPLIAAVLVSGCDYWKNLTADNRITSADANIKPTLKILNTPSPSIQVGCGDNPVYLNLLLTAGDADGTCDSITLISTATSSSLGVIHQRQNCLDTNNIKLQLSNPFSDSTGLGLERALTVTNHLKITVWDNDHGTHDTTISFVTRSNIVPKISIVKTDARAIFSNSDPVRFHVLATDEDSRLERMTLNWGDGTNRTTELEFLGIDTLAKDFTHQYPHPGEYTVSATIKDICGAITNANLGSTVFLQADDIPRIAIGNPGYTQADSLYYRMDLTVSDNDLESGQDTLSLAIDWGDGKKESLRPDPSGSGITFKKQLKHVYAQPPPDSAYRFSIGVDDLYGGHADSTLNILPYR